MASIPWREMITSDPHVMHGQACVTGTRVPTSVVLDSLAGGMTEDEIIAQYPSLTHPGIHASLAYAAELAQGEVVPLPDATDATG